ncbi:hypothetical protein GCK72_021448 [Caenorhabditis remanei]|uniref:F-box domain-containing protein n=1 Tax=Caenorhabditis remanei TaxID=31234 RepID=A0A6A5GJL7_CAERE|nr:hypothetical protein GCK72_021448 [Caenorhabditis remanei]KAF1754883.1 hypothetical protein GCK72_021448 [Caenorhabditis remanei]
MTSLIEIPEVAMTKVINKCDYQSIQVLRKVCKSLCSFIDSIKIGLAINYIYVIVESEEIRLHLYFKQHPQIIIEYQKLENGCSVVFFNEENRRKYLENDNFIYIFCMDFQLVLQILKAPIENLRFSFKSDTTSQEFAKKFDLPLRVEKLTVSLTHQNQLLSVLKHANSKFLKKILIVSVKRERVQLEINEPMELEQWRAAEQLTIRHFFVKTSVQKLTNFSNVYVNVETLSADDVAYLKEKFLNTESMKYFGVAFSKLINEEKLEQIFGHVDSTTDEYGQTKKVWSFEIPRRCLTLKISLFRYLVAFDMSEK